MEAHVHRARDEGDPCFDLRSPWFLSCAALDLRAGRHFLDVSLANAGAEAAIPDKMRARTVPSLGPPGLPARRSGSGQAPSGAFRDQAALYCTGRAPLHRQGEEPPLPDRMETCRHVRL